MKSAKLLSWLKKEGETVREGEPILVLETDKVTVEVEANASGVIARILLSAGDSAEVGSPLAIIAADHEVRDATSIDNFLKEVVNKSPEETAASGIPGSEILAAVAAKSPPAAGREIKVTPRVRKLAQELGVPLESVTPSGLNASITEEDIRKYASITKAGRRTDAPKIRERLTLSGIRKAMASHVTASWQTIPHFYQIIEIDAGSLMSVHKEQQISLTPYLVKAAGVALSRHPWVNATTDGVQLISYAEVNIAVAIGTERGLITPVVRNADQVSVRDIAAELERLTEQARVGQLSFSELEGATFTVSNLGMYGIETGTPIINGPQVALLFAGSVQMVPAWLEAKLVMASRMKLTFAYDHRVIDGIAGAHFSNEVRRLLEKPKEL